LASEASGPSERKPLPMHYSQPGATQRARMCSTTRRRCVRRGPREGLQRRVSSASYPERQPGSSLFSWEDAIRQCWLRSGQGVGGHQTSGRMGWRLPTIEQLASLVDSTQTPPSLPVGHPFKDAFGEESGVYPVYWSSTTDSRAAFFPGQAWELRLANGTVGDAGKTGMRRIWCVRGGPPADLSVE
jgi:hypothetical protein